MMEKDAFDFLTGLYNRKGLYEKYKELSPKTVRHMMFMDLDNFKAVNDVYGHHAGDELLIDTANLLKECEPEAVVVRLGGDEFVLLLTGDLTKEALVQTAENILKKVSKKSRQLQFYNMISVSIGIVWNASSECDLEQILGQSDAAMYQAKQNGKNGYIFYNDLEEKFLMEDEMEELAESALLQGQFKMSYFPVMHMQSSQLIHSHVRVHWYKDDNTIWDSEQFRPLFERNGFVRKLDLHVFENVCRDIKKFHDAGREKTVFSVRISRLLFLDERLGEQLQEIMDRYGVSADEFELNLGETAFAARDIDKLIDTMNRLKEQGFSLAIIDFGKEFSSFRYLRRLPINCIKFDEDYIKESLANSTGKQILKTIIKLGKELKFLVVALGLNTKEEVTTLSSYGCDAAGGYHYSESLPFEKYFNYIEKYMTYSGSCKAFTFKNNLTSTESDLPGQIIGDGVRFVSGISKNWGGVYFAGGNPAENVIDLPRTLFSANSYTIALWIKPEELNAWTSIIYMRYMDGFASLVPSVGGGLSVFRIKDDNDVNGWNDTFCRAVSTDKWSFIVVTYDAYTESVRMFINGRQAGSRGDVPTMISCRQVLLGGDPFQISYKGYVSALMIYDVVKTDDEIAELYNSFFNEPDFCGEKEEFWLENN